MAGKTALIIPSFSFHGCIFASATLIVLSFSFFSIRSLRSPLQSQNQYQSNLLVTAPNDGRILSTEESMPPAPSSTTYHSPEIFQLSYAEMESKFKVYIYPDGDPNTYYQTPRKLTGKYASEGYFFQNIRESRFRTEDPNQADLFFIPISCHKMRGKFILLVLLILNVCGGISSMNGCILDHVVFWFIDNFSGMYEAPIVKNGLLVDSNAYQIRETPGNAWKRVSDCFLGYALDTLDESSAALECLANLYRSTKALLPDDPLLLDKSSVVIVSLGISYDNMTIIVQNYVDGLRRKYPYWNRTLGSDHFLVTCHDVGVRAFEGLPLLIKNSIRVVCSPSYNAGFIPHKDVALPQVLQPFALPSGGNDVVNRTILGFWAGHRNSKIRVILAHEWENDTQLAISNNRISRATGELVYQKQFYKSKFCICPGGSQVNSARIADSIHYGCVPVILSDYYDLPFQDILVWRKFALVLKEKDVYLLKSILTSISDEEFVSLHKGLVEPEDVKVGYVRFAQSIRMVIKVEFSIRCP
ncbi:putative glycosyltransferase [Platanthera zijinensis]|uniref:Glycosyltransferase n=1 Tax=Platanthera zijinensis TaxID=2320716 RepID=A0AAP0G132_9ASPA